MQTRTQYPDAAALLAMYSLYKGNPEALVERLRVEYGMTPTYTRQRLRRLGARLPYLRRVSRLT